MRIACPLSTGRRSMSVMSDPPSFRIAPTSIGFSEVEHQPHRIGPAKQRRRRRPAETERQAQAVAAPYRVEGHSVIGDPVSLDGTGDAAGFDAATFAGSCLMGVSSAGVSFAGIASEAATLGIGAGGAAAAAGFSAGG